MRLFLSEFVFCLAMLMSTTTSFALAPAWKINEDKSELTFTATQNNAPVKGEFKTFDCQINFDPNQLDDSKVKVVVSMGSLATSYDDLTATLNMPDWFNVNVFPQAIFEAAKFVKTGDNQYKAEGTLTIKDKSQPVTLLFSAKQPDPKHATVTGSTEINRSAFAVGIGEWASTDEVKDAVKVNFVLDAVKGS